MRELTGAAFQPHLREEFRLHGGPASMPALTLADVNGEGRPFSIEFLGPRDPVLPQRIYRLEHPALGALELFIVPIGRDADGVRYEAVFN